LQTHAKSVSARQIGKGLGGRFADMFDNIDVSGSSW